MDLVCVGDVMLDVRVDAGALARGGDVHGRVVVQPGGTSANAAAWARWAGASARVLARTGDDLAGRLVREALVERGVEAPLPVDPSEPTGTMLVVHEGGERSMVADRGANARLRPDDLPATIEAGAVLVSGYLLLHEDTRAAARAAIERSVSGWIGVDAASWPLLAAAGPARFLEHAAGATVLLANDREAQVLTGSTGEEAATILGKRFRAAFVKRGPEGAVGWVEGEPVAWAVEPVEEIDPTGAGDAFDGVLLSLLGGGATIGDALARACLAGALAAGSESTWPVAR